MASAIATARLALFKALGTVEGLRTFNYDASDPKTPGAVVQFPTVIERTTLGDKWRYEIPTALIVSLASPRAADQELTELVDTVIDALEADPNLDGTIESTAVLSCSPQEVGKVADVDVLMVTLVVEVLAG